MAHTYRCSHCGTTGVRLWTPCNTLEYHFHCLRCAEATVGERVDASHFVGLFSPALPVPMVEVVGREDCSPSPVNKVFEILFTSRQHSRGAWELWLSWPAVPGGGAACTS